MRTTMYVIGLMFYTSLCWSYIYAKLEQDWLNHQQYKCIDNPVNLAEMVQTYYRCVSKSTIQCIQHDDYTTRGSVSEELRHRFVYFCGVISGTNLRKKTTQWSITSPHRHPIRLIFLKFSLKHRKYRCVLEKMTIKTKTRDEQFCGRRLHWIADYFETEIQITLYSEFIKIDIEYFKLQYHQITHLIYVNTYILSLNHMIGIIDLYHIKYRSFHFLSHYKFQTVQVKLESQCVDMICHDGPGTLSPIVKPNKETFPSTSYQMKCLVVIRYPTCLSSLKINYHFKSLVLGEENYGYMDWRNMEYLMWRSFQNISNLVHWGYLSSYNHRNPGIQLHVSHNGGENAHILLEGESCIYGGLFVYEIASEKIAGCPECVMTSSISTRNDTNNTMSNPQCRLCIEGTCFPCTYLKEVWAQCTVANNKHLYLDSNGPLLLIHIYYKQYSTGFPSVRTSKQYNYIYNVPKVSTIFCIADKNISHGIENEFNIVLKTSEPQFHIYVQPRHESEVIYKKYVFRFTEPRSILLTYYPNSQEDDCAYCIVKYTASSNFIEKFSKIIDIKYFAFENEFESPVIEISVNLDKCEQMTYIGWVIVILSTNSITTGRQTPKPIFMQMNQTLILPIHSLFSHHKLHLRLGILSLDYYWYMVSVQNLHEGIWKVTQEIPCQISQIFLEVLSMNASHSDLYLWKELSKQSMSWPQLSTWITGCFQCIFIYESTPSENKDAFCTSTDEANLKMDIQRQVGLSETLSGSNQNLIQSQYTFHKYR